MSDIFISYARADRVLAESLANDLRERGYRVWWDAELVGSDDFYEVILQALNNAKAAIVIWTTASCKSRFVRDEARFALHLEKLIATKEPSLDTYAIPFGFQCQHTDDVNDREHIVRAIDKLGIKPVAGPAAPSIVGDWDKLKTTGNIDELVDFLGTSPIESQRQAAAARLKHLSENPTTATASNAVVRSLASSNWEALWSGLTFRAPAFQLTNQGTWTSIGLAVSALVILGLGGSFLVAHDFFVDDWHTPEEGVLYWGQPNRIISKALNISLWGASSLLIWTCVRYFVRAKLLAATIVLGVAFMTCIFLASFYLFEFAHLEMFWPNSGVKFSTFAIEYNKAYQFAFAVSCLVVSAALLFRTIRAAR